MGFDAVLPVYEGWPGFEIKPVLFLLVFPAFSAVFPGHSLVVLEKIPGILIVLELPSDRIFKTLPLQLADPLPFRDSLGIGFYAFVFLHPVHELHIVLERASNLRKKKTTVVFVIRVVGVDEHFRLYFLNRTSFFDLALHYRYGTLFYEAANKEIL